jgi:anionic cell wall polymer biosynthesis LytR-Cps2A-Psr (LCP) family protein
MKWPSWSKKPFGAAALSFLFPGLGQAAAGDWRRGAIVAIPAVAIAILLVGLVLFARKALLDNATNQQWLMSLMLLNLVALIYHCWAMADAYLMAARSLPRQRRARGGSGPARKWTTAAAIVVLASGPLLVHGAIAVEDASLQSAAGCLNSLVPCWLLDNPSAIESQAPLAGNNDNNISVASGTPSLQPDASVSPSASASSSVAPVASLPVPLAPDMQTTQNSADWAKDKMLNLLLVGMDAAPGRQDTLTDTMILLQVDMTTGKSAMYGIARNMYCMPLPKQIGVHFPNPPATYACAPGTFTSPYDANGLSNAIFYDAAFNAKHRDWYPGYPLSACDGKSGNDLAVCQLGQNWGRGTFALEQAIGALTGVSVDGTAIINLPGFAKVVDDLGGIDITVPAKSSLPGTGPVTDYPCGPKGTWPAAWRVCDLRTDLPVTPGQCLYYNSSGTYKGDHCHYGYSVSDGTGAIVARMKSDAAKSGGLQSITWSAGPDIAFTIKPGLQHMDGEWALAYARSRIYTTDYDRMARQQWVLQAIRNNVKHPCSLIPSLLDPNGLLKDLNNFVWTNMPKDGSSLTTLAGLAERVTGDNVQRFSLDPSTLHSPAKTTLIDAAGWAQARYIVQHGLDKAPASSPGGGSGGSGGGGFSC